MFAGVETTRPHKAVEIRSITMSSVQLPDISVELDENGHLSVDFLLPSGILVPLNVDFYASLDLIKKVASFFSFILFTFFTGSMLKMWIFFKI